MTVQWIDKHDDVWTDGDDGLMHAPETAPFPREHVAKKWGPLRPLVEANGEQIIAQRPIGVGGEALLSIPTQHGLMPYGEIVDGAWKPEPGMNLAYTPECLQAITELIEANAGDW